MLSLNSTVAAAALLLAPLMVDCVCGLESHTNAQERAVYLSPASELEDVASCLLLYT